MMPAGRYAWLALCAACLAEVIAPRSLAADPVAPTRQAEPRQSSELLRSPQRLIVTMNGPVVGDTPNRPENPGRSWVQPIAAREDPNSHTLTVSTPAGSFRIPESYLVTQATSRNDHLSFSSATFAFEIQMPDGSPVNHDYGLEGLPDVKPDEKSYPIVVNGISFETSVSNLQTPERMLGNFISAFAPEGLQIEHDHEMVILQPVHHADLWIVQYYLILPSIGASGRLSAFLRCQQITSGEGLPSACDGWEFAENMGLLMHVRFPRLKLNEFPIISEHILKKVESWKQS